MANRIYNLKTVSAERSFGVVPAVQMGIDVDDRTSLDSFLKDVAEKIVLQRMCSPPDTSILFISIIGDLPPAEFKERWLSLVAQDRVLSFFMS